MKKKFKKFIIKLTAIIGALAVYLSICASKILLNIGVSKFEAQISTASYIAIGKVLEQQNFSDIFSLEKNNEGDIILVTTNGLKINYLAKKLADEAYVSYNVLADGGVQVPICALSGITFLSGLGKPINMRLITVNSVRCEFRSEFESAGINQTKQSMYLTIVPDCTVIAGFFKKKLANSIEILCYENYIIGNVPNTVVNITGYTATSTRK